MLDAKNKGTLKCSLKSAPKASGIEEAAGFILHTVWPISSSHQSQLFHSQIVFQYKSMNEVWMFHVTGTGMQASALVQVLVLVLSLLSHLLGAMPDLPIHGHPVCSPNSEAGIHFCPQRPQAPETNYEWVSNLLIIPLETNALSLNVSCQPVRHKTCR